MVPNLSDPDFVTDSMRTPEKKFDTYGTDKRTRIRISVNNINNTARSKFVLIGTEGMSYCRLQFYSLISKLIWYVLQYSVTLIEEG